MEEPDFWERLEYRITHEFAGFADSRLRHYWCDGLIPEEHALQGDHPCIHGRAWCGPNGQEHWRFTLVVGQTIDFQGHIDWPALLPGRGLTGWLTPDPERKALKIDPLAGYSDDL